MTRMSLIWTWPFRAGNFFMVSSRGMRADPREPLRARQAATRPAIARSGASRRTHGSREERRRSPAVLGILFCAASLFAGQAEKDYAAKRVLMVREQIAARGIKDRRLLAVLETVPRHLFVPAEVRGHAYDDFPLPIGNGQTISQPYIVAFMTDCLGLAKTAKVLEIGTGSGYQAAVLSRLAAEVYTIEIDEQLALRAADTLKSLGYLNVRVRTGDGFSGWPEEAPFDAVIVTCAAPAVPPRLFDQLAEGGRFVIPLGETGAVQTLTLITKVGGKPVERRLLDVRFVPMTGAAEKKK